MSDVIFARPRHNYDSYSDLYRLIALSGFPLIHFDEIEPESDNTYILTILNGENQNGWRHARARIIWWDLEWRLEGDYPRVPGVREVWAADRWYAEQIGARYVPMGSHADLPPAPLEDCPKEYDVAMLAYMTYRRMHMRDRLKRAGISISPQGWGLERHAILQRTKAMLCVHQMDNAPTIAPQRWTLAAAYRLPMLCETVHDVGIFGHSHAMYASYDYLPDMVRLWKDDQRLKDYAEALHGLLCREYTFRRSVEVAL